MTHNDYASPHAATTYQMWPHHWQRPLVEPDVRFSRIRLSDDLSPVRHSQGVDGSFMQVDQPLVTQGLIQRRPLELLTAPVAPRRQKTTEPTLDVPVDLLERYPWVSKAEVASPTYQQAIDTAYHPVQGGGYVATCQRFHLLAQSAETLFGGDDVQIPALSPEAAVVAEGKPEKVETAPAFLQVDHRRLVPVQDQTQFSQGFFDKAVDTRTDVPRHDDPVIGIPHQPCIRETPGTVRCVEPLSNSCR